MADGILKVGQITTSSGSGTITIGQSGETVNIPSGTTALASEPADTDEFLVSDAGTLKRMDYSHIKAGGSTPAFFAHLGSNQTGVSDDTWTKVNFNTEVFDSDGTYDNSSNYRWTPGVAGKSMITTMVWAQGGSDNTLRRNQTAIYKNGSLFASSIMNTLDAEEHHRSSVSVSIVDSHDDDDYYEVFCSADVSSGTVHADADGKGTWFCGYKLIGV